MKNVRIAYAIIIFSFLVSTTEGNMSLPPPPSSVLASTGLFLSDSSVHEKGEGYIVPLQDTNLLLTQVEISVAPVLWMCMVSNYDFHVEGSFTIANPTGEQLTTTLAFPFTIHDIYGDHDEFETIDISDGDVPLYYSVAKNNDFFIYQDHELYFKGQPISFVIHPMLGGADDLATVAPNLYADNYELIAYWDLSFAPGETKIINVNFIHYSGLNCCYASKNHFTFDVTYADNWNNPIAFTGTFLKQPKYQSISTSFYLQETEDYFLLTGTDDSQKIEVVILPVIVDLEPEHQTQFTVFPEVSTQYDIAITNNQRDDDIIDLMVNPATGADGSVIGYVSPTPVFLAPYETATVTLFVSGDQYTAPGDYEVTVSGVSRLTYYDYDVVSTLTRIILNIDSDDDGTLDGMDNCPYDYNPNQEDSDADACGDDCDNCLDTENIDQADTYPPGGNSIGDACDCEGNFSCDADSDVDGSDAALFKADFGRSVILDPCTSDSLCNGDFNCDGDADGTDAALFKQDFGRSEFNNPCPACEISEWCDYAVSTSTSTTTMPATTTTSTVPGITTTTLPITTSTVPGSTTTTMPISTTTAPSTTTTPAQCELIISPASEIVYTWEHIQFSTTLDGVCNPPCYSWDVASDIGSTIDNNGFYTAGGSAGIDTVEVRDNCNAGTFDSAVVEVVLFTTTIPPTTTTTAP